MDLYNFGNGRFREYSGPFYRLISAFSLAAFGQQQSFASKENPATEAGFFHW
jgi:hypothetical protein